MRFHELVALCAWLILAALVQIWDAAPVVAAEIKAAILRVENTTPPPISRLDLAPKDLGFAGGKLATADNQTTGRFLGHTFSLQTMTASSKEAETVLRKLIDAGIGYIVILANATDATHLANKAGSGILLFNAKARDVSLRDKECRANLLHIAPSRAMIADALAQFLVWKKWPRWLLIHGSHPEDKLLAQRYRKAAKKFGAKIVQELEFKDTGGARRTDSGHVQVQKQIPLFTQGATEHDVIVAADEHDVFAAHIPFHSWDPSPVTGSAGLRPVTWHPSLEAWGATQVQRRFEKQTGRYMRQEDYQAWLALRVLGEAVIRTGSADVKTNRNYMLGPDFELAAFKGTKVTFRPWNGQLRQAILLTDGRVLVSVSPQVGFLHQRSPLDSLGLDKPETKCAAFGKER